jgi:hypothetical protein
MSESEMRALMKKKLGKKEYLKWLKERKEKAENAEKKKAEKKKRAASRKPNAPSGQEDARDRSRAPEPRRNEGRESSTQNDDSGRVAPWTSPEEFAVEGVDVGDAGEAGEGPTRESGDSLSRGGESAFNSALSGSQMMRGWQRAPEDLPGGDPGRVKNPSGNLSGSNSDAFRGGWRAPATNRDLVASAYSGFAPSYKKLGLKLGTDKNGRSRIVDTSGRPATPAQIAALRAQIASEPRALLRRPDFFQVVPRKRFDALKTTYRAASSLRSSAFQDIAMTSQGRDFSWSSTCHTLSGACNPSAMPPSYRRGTDVSPETLNRVYERIERESPEALPEDAEADEGDGEWDEDDDGLDWLDEEWDDYTEEEEQMADAADRAREKLSRGVFGRARDAIGGLLGRAGRVFGGGNFFASGPEAGGRFASAGIETVPAAAISGSPSPGGASREAGSSAGVGPSRAIRGSPPPSGNSEKRRPPSGRALLYLACAAGALGFFLLAFARRG